MKGVYEPVEVTVKDALEKGYIKTEWQAFFMAWAKRFLEMIGVPFEKQRFVEKLEWERAHYSVQGYDQEIFLERWGWVEVSGHNYRTDYDLKRHMEHSGADMRIFKEYKKPIMKEKVVIKPVKAEIGPEFKGEASKVTELLEKTNPKEVEESFEEKGYYILGKYKILPKHVEIVREKVEEKGRRFVPHVVEPSFGLDRLVYVALEYAYKTKEGRAILSFPRDIAPIQVGVYPLVSKDGLPEKAREIHQMLVKEGFTVEYDESGSIGRRYARADEIGTPLGITVDYQTLEDNTVTIRNRDSWKQVRTEIERLPSLLREYFMWKIEFEDLGKPFKE
jgi:glycyl-tRNA synthetase